MVADASDKNQKKNLKSECAIQRSAAAPIRMAERQSADLTFLAFRIHP
jgi:hypothetical protein